MESTSEVSCNSTKSTARTRVRRGISLEACVANAAGWTLEKAKHVTLPEIKEYKETWCGLSHKSLQLCTLQWNIGIIHWNTKRELLRVISTFSTRTKTKLRVGNFVWHPHRLNVGCTQNPKATHKMNKVSTSYAIPTSKTTMQVDRVRKGMCVPESEGERQNLHRPRVVSMCATCQHGKRRQTTRVGSMAPSWRGWSKWLSIVSQGVQVT